MVTGITDSSSTNRSTTSGNITNSLTTSKDQFLKLLVAQLKNQDPLNTSDPEKFTEQLTQFGQLEQLQNLNTAFDSLKSQQISLDKSQAVSYIGKQVDVPGNKVLLSPDQTASLGFVLEKDASNVSIDILNNNNQVVRTLELANMNKGSNFVTYDKKDRFGNNLPSGTYTYRVKSFDSHGNTTNVSTLVRGVVSQVDFSGEEVLVKVNGLNLPASQVKAVYGV